MLKWTLSLLESPPSHWCTLYSALKHYDFVDVLSAILLGSYEFDFALLLLLLFLVNISSALSGK